MNKNDLLNKYTRNSPIKWKKKGFCMLPTTLLFDTRLSSFSLVVFWVLTVHTFKGKENCFPTIKTICSEAHISRPTAIRVIRQLEECGYLETEKEKGKSTKYYLKVKV